MKKIKLLILVLSVPLLCACNNDADKNRMKIIEELYSNIFQMNLDGMLIVNPIGQDQAYKYGTYNFVWYVDSNSCSTCALGNLEKWDFYLKNLKENYDVGFYPVFSPPKSQSSIFINRAKAQYAEYPIIIDTAGFFKKRNIFLPSEQLYHTFLIDSLGKIINVGTPINNVSLQKVILKRIKKRKQAEE